MSNAEIGTLTSYHIANRLISLFKRITIYVGVRSCFGVRVGGAVVVAVGLAVLGLGRVVGRGRLADGDVGGRHEHGFAAKCLKKAY